MLCKHPHVFWDWDGTLADNMPVYNKVFQETHRRFDLPELDEHFIYRNTGTTSVKHFSNYLPEERVAEAITFYQHLLELYINDIKLFPDTVELLTAVQEAGSKNIIVSNKPHLPLLKDIHRFGLNGLIAAAVGGTELTNHKPHPDHMHLAAQRAGVAVTPADTMVGDSPADYEIAKAAGTFAYLLHSQVHDFKGIIKNNPRAVVVSRPLLHKTLFQP